MKKVIFIGAAGRDFHNFNVYFQDNEHSQVTALTAKQIKKSSQLSMSLRKSGSTNPATALGDF